MCKPAWAVAAVSGGIVMAVVQRLVADRAIEEDLSPSSASRPHGPDAARGGRVVVTIEYFIHPARANEFRAVMREAAAAACARARWTGS